MPRSSRSQKLSLARTPRDQAADDEARALRDAAERRGGVTVNPECAQSEPTVGSQWPHIDPSLDPDAKPTLHMSLRINEYERAMLHAFAQRERRSVAQWIRQVVWERMEGGND